MGESIDEIRVARAGLLRVIEPPSPTLTAFVAEHGPVLAWEKIRHRAAPGGLRRSASGRTDGSTADQLQRLAIDDLRRASESGARLVVPEQDEWPAATMAAFEMSDLVAPLGLYVRGTALPPEQRGAVTIVGSRACTAYGRRVAAELAGDVAGRGSRVVSGAAFGVDAAAHRGAMSAAGARSTIAVLACGIDRVYPVANKELIDEIAAGGGVVLSEYPPGTTPARHRFLVRNRLIAAFGAVTVVVEAGRRSGTISTANAATELNRVVMAVPGPVTSALSIGCHDLLRKGQAVVATSASDVLDAMGLFELSPPPEMPAKPTDLVVGETAKVYEALPGRGGRTVWELAQESGVPAGEVMIALAELELQELAERDGPNWRRLR
jgi:DNA processing protein